MAKEENALVVAVQNRAWDIKDVCDDLTGRKISGRDETVLTIINRDMERLRIKLVAVRDKRKRKTNGAEVEAG